MQILQWVPDGFVQSVLEYQEFHTYLQLVHALLPVTSLYCIKLLIEPVTRPHPDFNQMILAITGQYAAYISNIHQQKLTDYLAREVLLKAVSVDYEYYENPAYHDTLHLAQQQSLYNATSLLTGFYAAVLNGFSLLFLASFFMSIHSLFALLFIIFLLPVPVIKWYSGIAFQQQERKLAPLEREAAYLHQTLTAVNYAKEQRVFGYGHFLIPGF